ncbi:MAG: acireductone synthase [Proteobacteria bacterium]|nr:MAG: acireductone synthase [Pseudomonadota bacterium]
MSKVRPKVYLLDVEGTVAPLSLTTDLLFPYARTRFAEFLERNRADESVRADLVLLAEENRAETGDGTPHLPKISGAAEVATPRFRLDAMAYLMWLMDRDRKSTALKSLQGKIWKAGFESGELKPTLFADVPDAFRRWSAEARVAIYSSGSVEAQKLLFRYSNFGDLTPLIGGYFDTRTGTKTAGASYAAIAAAMEVAPGEVLFFSDAVRELDAAREAGCQTRLAVREGNASVEDAHGHAMIASLD